MACIRAIALALAVITLTGPVTHARVDVKIAFDKAFNFKPVRTWNWRPGGPGEVKMARTQTDNPEAAARIAEPIIVDAVTIEMERRKLQKVASDPDMTVAYFLLLTTNMSTQTVGQFIPPVMDWGLPLFPPATQSLKVLNQGSLVLDLSARGTVVWRGVAEAKIKMDASGKQREAVLREAVRDLLRRYPPKQ
jgi:hypothetical protein